MTSQRPRSSRPPSQYPDSRRSWADLRSRGSSFVAGAVITLAAFAVGRFAGTPAEPADGAAQLVPHVAEASPPAARSPQREPLPATELAVARTVLAQELAAPDAPAPAPIVSPGDLPLEEAKLDAATSASKSKARSGARPRARDGF